MTMRYTFPLLASLLLAACSPALPPLMSVPAQAQGANIVIDAKDGGDLSVTFTSTVAAARRLMSGAPTVADIATIEFALYRTNGADPGLKNTFTFSGDPTGKGVKLTNLRANAQYRIEYVAKDDGGNPIGSPTTQSKTFGLDAHGVSTATGPLNIQLANLYYPSTVVNHPGLILTEGALPIKGFVEPYAGIAETPLGGIAVGPDGSIYVPCSAGIRRIKPDQSVDGDFTVSGLLNPQDVAIADGNLYIADTGNNRIAKYPIAGGSVTTVGAVGSPYAVAVGPDGYVYATSSTEHRLVRFDAAGALGEVIGAYQLVIAKAESNPGYVTGANANDYEAQELNRAVVASYVATALPGGLAFDGRGNLFMTERGDKGLWRVAPDGTIKLMRNVAFTPLDLVIGTDGLTYVTGDDKKLYSVDGGDQEVFVAGGNGTRQVTAQGEDVGFGNLAGIAMDANGFLYLADTGAANYIRKVF